MINIIGILLLLFLSGCGSTEAAPKSLYVDKLDNINEEEKAMIYKTIARINQDAGEELISLSKKRNGKPVVFRSLSREELTDDESVLAHARYFEYHCLIEMRTDLREKVVRSFLGNFNYRDGDYEALGERAKERVDNGVEFALLHELGHCLGFTHTQDIGDVMYPAIQPSWDEENLTKFIEKIRNAFF